MTEEEKAKKWVKENCCEWCINADDCKLGCIDCHAITAYLAGFHEGQPKWHDLRKDPNDLPPKKEGKVHSEAVMTNYGEWAIYDYNKKHWMDGILPYPKDVHKWASIELPKGEEDF